ncbi:MAG TPA: DNA polymerase III subunit epsilon [Porticoccaceae bacterium]|nr:DNA polymerase III subunit epsilon [Porticoccaceae bacterium]
MRQIVLDTETTGLETSQDHRIIEIGCVELINRKLTGRHYHQYINPHRDIDEGAMAVHGITTDFLADKPSFELVFEDFLHFVDGADLVIHNAPFDVGFLNHEIDRLASNSLPIDQHCRVIDTLAIARKKHPGQKNNLDALCKRYGVDNSQRDLHGALLDAEILADVYLFMSGGQVTLNIDQHAGDNEGQGVISRISRISSDRPRLPVIAASDQELQEHAARLVKIQAESGRCLWLDSGD